MHWLLPSKKCLASKVESKFQLKVDEIAAIAEKKINELKTKNVARRKQSNYRKIHIIEWGC